VRPVVDVFLLRTSLTQPATTAAAMRQKAMVSFCGNLRQSSYKIFVVQKTNNGEFFWLLRTPHCLFFKQPISYNYQTHGIAIFTNRLDAKFYVSC
jgi:hypothetical protein